MEDRIGELAGNVWRYLEEEGKASVSQVGKAVNAPKSKVDMALGWLAREDKLEFVDEKRGTSVKLS